MIAGLPALLLETVEELAPAFDAADGIKADLERRGWSPSSAEAVAEAWLIGVVGLWFPAHPTR